MSPLFALVILLFSTMAIAGPVYNPVSTPETLKEWVPWIQSKHPDLDCSTIDGSRVCAWPTRLELQANGAGARFVLEVVRDTPGGAVLPGGPGAWPNDVLLDGRPVAVLSTPTGPQITLGAGSHRVTGRLAWASLPPSIPVPPSAALIALNVNGEEVARPVFSDGQLRLGVSDIEAAAGQSIALDVSRRIVDGVPLVITTRIDLRVSGSPEELDLGAVALANTVPVSMDSKLPARFNQDGHLIVQVRPGAWVLTFDARHEGPALSLTAPTLVSPWPEAEYWVFQSDDVVRATTLSGPPGIEASRTPVPAEWSELPSYRVESSTPMLIEELRRGEPEPNPNQLVLNRDIWLDMAGDGFTVRDHFAGSMKRGWRLNALAPLSVGHASDHNQDQVITGGPQGTAGVELRSAAPDVTIESRIDGRPSVLPAVGWDTDTRRLSATLRLPPGYKLLTALGVDSLTGSVLDAWTLFDLFFVLIVAMATWRVLDWKMGLAMLVGLALSRHQVMAPKWIWVALVVVLAIAKAVKVRWAAVSGRITTWVMLVLLTVMLVPWGVVQLRNGLFPVLDEPAPANPIFDFSKDELDEDMSLGRRQLADVPSDGKGMSKRRAQKSLSLQFDPSAKVQTGPGVPNREWAQVQMRWSGPVTREHQIRLVLLGPIELGLLAFARVGLFVLLAFGFAKAASLLGRAGSPKPPAEDDKAGTADPKKVVKAAISAGLVLLGLSMSLALGTDAQAEPEPDDSKINELEARIIQGPACRPACTTTSAASLSVRDGVLRIVADVHSGDLTSWPVPGPASTWVPSRVTLDGATARAVSRRPDGHLHVRIEAGVHRIIVEGPLPPGNAHTLQWGLVPQRVDFSGATQWAVEGRRADGTSESYAQLSRVVKEEGEVVSHGADNLAPWVSVERRVDLGVPWTVQTTVRRVGPTRHPLALRIPLLPGESVTDASYEGQGLDRLVTLSGEKLEVTWTGTLTDQAQLAMTAPEQVPWSEHWIISCSPVFSCAFAGPAPLTHVRDGVWESDWRPWPGETVTVTVDRLQAVLGGTTTIDSAELDLTPGRRQLEASLTLSVRTSQGGTQTVTLPQGARLTQVSIGGKTKPLQTRDDGTVAVPLQPGSQSVVLKWLQPHPSVFFDRMPRVLVGGEAVNATVTIRVPQERWIVGLMGPRWGPVPLYWVYIIVVLGGATALWRFKGSPLAWWQWVLLGLGCTQVPVIVPIIVAFWLLAMAWRGRAHPQRPWLFNLVQIGLVLYTLVALGCLYAAVHAGLLIQPDMQVWGNNSSDSTLIYYVDRVADAMPQPVLMTLPVWVWRVIMLLWSLWLAASLVMWLRKGWTWLGTGGWYRPMNLVAKPLERPASDEG